MGRMAKSFQEAAHERDIELAAKEAVQEVVRDRSIMAEVRLNQLLAVRRIEEILGRPVLSNASKAELMGMDAQDYADTMARVHQRHMGELFGAPYRGRN